MEARLQEVRGEKVKLGEKELKVLIEALALSDLVADYKTLAEIGKSVRRKVLRAFKIPLPQRIKKLKRAKERKVTISLLERC